MPKITITIEDVPGIHGDDVALTLDGQAGNPFAPRPALSRAQFLGWAAIRFLQETGASDGATSTMSVSPSTGDGDEVV